MKPTLNASASAATEASVERFYEQGGWSADAQGHTKDAELWEDLRPCAHEYVSGCRKRLLKHIPIKGHKILDAASGPVQYPEYLLYSQGFDRRTCVDISGAALEQAERRLGAKGEYVKASLLDLPMETASFDATLSLHTIYHIEQNSQAKAVRELLRVTKPGAPVVVVYANPDKLLSTIKRWFKPTPPADSGRIYYFAHPLSWWRQFSDEARVELHPWRSLTAQDAKRFIPDSGFGRALYKFFFWFEDTFPALATRWGAYPVITLRKR